MKSILPIILVVLLLTGAITYSLAKRAIPKRDENRFGIAANELKGKTGEALTPTPTQMVLSGLIATPTKAQTPTSMPTVSEKETQTKGGVVTKTVIKTTKTTVCTPVYGMANTCIEHVVVDTGAADAIFFNFAGFAYLAGLASFIKAKTLKK